MIVTLLGSPTAAGGRFAQPGDAESAAIYYFPPERIPAGSGSGGFCKGTTGRKMTGL